uniref:Uncharacterized protein n=1 Tax=Arundo donax TaxID=35708 RepID=A0A0A9BQT6_ARUDO
MLRRTMQYFGTLQLKQWFDFPSYTMNRMGLQQHKQEQGARGVAHERAYTQ